MLLVFLACIFSLFNHVFSHPHPLANNHTPRSALNNPYANATPIVSTSYVLQLNRTLNHFLSQSDALNAARTRTVQKIPVFEWIYSATDLPKLQAVIRKAVAEQERTGTRALVQVVVSAFPVGGCSAIEFPVSPEKTRIEEYRALADALFNLFTDQTSKANSLSYAVILEPGTMGDLVANSDLQSCSNKARYYRDLIPYAIANLQAPNIHLYLDGADGSWFGWVDNLRIAADMYGAILKAAKVLRSDIDVQVRGLATNIGNYNPYNATVLDPIAVSPYNVGPTESLYIQALTPHLIRASFPAHFIVDQSRSGQLGIRKDWTEWCNIQGAGFGTRPTTDQAILKNENVDAIVWVKRGGESDGTSDSTSFTYNSFCGKETSKRPAPEKGEWFNEYAADLVRFASPELDLTW